jgi:hypothetical protein
MVVLALEMWICCQLLLHRLGKLMFSYRRFTVSMHRLSINFKRVFGMDSPAVHENGAPPA